MLRPLALTSLLILVLVALLTAHPANASSPLQPHPPISIVGNSGFTLANGTIAGDGSTSNPYIIAGWNISAVNTDGIDIEQANASFIIRNVYIHGQSQSNGIFLLDVTSGVVDNVTITNSLDGITITLSNATIENSHIFTNTNHGVRILDGENINLFNNTLTQEMGDGIFSENCVRCDLNVTKNTISSNLSGIVLQSMNNSFIFQNNISWNTNDGIGVYGSRYVIVVLNNISYNGVGVTLSLSMNNLVHHNNFFKNHKQAFDDITGQNMWDVGYASGGNYWSDYNGQDQCSGPAQDFCPRPDGIGDTPYIFTNARDNYPLTRLFIESIIHDVAVSSITPSAMVVNQTGAILIAVVVRNEGAVTENFTLTLYYDLTVIGTEVVPSLVPGGSESITFNWNTTGVAAGVRYFKAIESTVWGEIDITDNKLVEGPITIKAGNTTTPPPSENPPQPSTSPDVYVEAGILVVLIVFFLAFATSRRRGRAH